MNTPQNSYEMEGGSWVRYSAYATHSVCTSRGSGADDATE